MPLFPDDNNLYPSTTLYPQEFTEPLVGTLGPAWHRADQLSGIVLSQDGPLSSLYQLPTVSFLYQTFHLPEDYKRTDRIPDLTGVQICASVPDADTFSMDVTLDVLLPDAPNWMTLGVATIDGAHVTDTQVWVDAYFTNPVAIPDQYLTQQFRIGLKSTSQVWISVPAPLTGESTVNSGNIRFRILASVADSGQDFLGNKYRSAVVRNSASKISTRASDDPNAFWLSKPNPSKYAVECLYFDMRGVDERPTVVDYVLMDPITPGIWFHVYYTSEGDPGTTDAEWEEKLWTPVSKSFRADRRQEHVLPEPIVAKYICVEFCHLQAQYYQAGLYHQAIQYKKHPKWVLDAFLIKAINPATSDAFVARRVQVVYDALELGFDYYLDDLIQKPSDPDKLRPGTIAFLNDRSDQSDQIDTTTLANIRIAMQPYTDSINKFSQASGYLLSTFVETSDSAEYPVENIRYASANTREVSVLDRENLIVENNYPVMSFYLTCRHGYREVEAYFSSDKAYFAGVRELAFTREDYASAADLDLYVETLSDFSNAVRNDFIPDGFRPALGN